MKKSHLVPILLISIFVVSTNSIESCAAIHSGTLNELKQAIADTTLNSNFYQKGNITLDANLGEIQTSGDFRIFQDPSYSYSVNGNSKSGFIVGADKTLNIKNVGALDGSGNVTSSFTAFSSTGNGSVVKNSGTTNISNSVFSSNASDSGGVIFNTNTGNSTINFSTFKDNNSNGFGGAITNQGTMTVSDSSFTNNRGSWNDGGAIYNEGNLTIRGSAFNSNWNGTGGAIGNVTNADVSFSTFTNNSGARGGAIHNNNAIVISNSTFTGNNATDSGGAFYSDNYSDSIIAIIRNSTFTNNIASGENAKGGAIYLNSGSLAIQSTEVGKTVFSGNKDTGGTNSNAIYIASNKALELDSGKGGRVLFDDKIDSSSNSNTINLNTDSTYNSGNILFNDTVSNVHLNMAGGILSLGKNGNTLTSTYFNNVDYKQTGGILDLANKNADTISLNSFSASGTSSLYMDIDFVGGTNDKITTNTATGAMAINGINVLTDTSNSSGSVNIFTNSSPTLAGSTTFTNTNKYVFTAGSTGNLDYTMQSLGGAIGLNEAAANNAMNRSFSATGDLTIQSAINQMQGANSTFTIFGNGYDLNGNGKNGTVTLAGQTLNIYNAGSLNESGGINTSWHGFSNGTGGFLYNHGNANIFDSVFASNTVSQHGGVIFNETAANLVIVDSTFSGNKTTGGYAGVLYNNTNAYSWITGSTFTGNSSPGDGGVIRNLGTMYIANSTFSNNTGNYGGAINNFNPAANLTIKDSFFSKNYSSNMGGAICHGSSAASLTISGTQFLDNTSGSEGAGIYSENPLSVTNSYFTQNSANNHSGGAIRQKFYGLNVNSCTFYANGIDSTGTKFTNDGAAVFVELNNDQTGTISNSEFSKNASNNVGGAINQQRGTLNVTNSTFTDNFTSGTTYGYGGAIGSNNGTLSIANCTFIKNGINFSDETKSKFGGAVSNTTGTLSVSDSSFENNAALNNGGAIYANGTFNNLSNATFLNNTAAGVGGAIYTYGLNAISHSSFINNSASSGGAIYNDRAAMSLNIDNSIFINNTATTTRGGSIYSMGKFTINNCSFENNTGVYAGAIEGNSLSDVISTIQNSTFTGNHSTNQGGALLVDSGIVNISGTTFSGNYNSGTWHFGGAICDLGNVSVDNSIFNGNGLDSDNAVKTKFGGAFYLQHTGSITNSSFTGNAAINYGGALMNDNSSGIITISDSTFTGNYTTDSSSHGGAISNSGHLTVTNSDFNGNYTVKNGAGIYTSGTAIITDSRFKNNYTTGEDWGGAIRSDSGTLTVSGSTFGGYGTDDGNKAYCGGAISNKSTTVNISDSWFIKNNATATSAIGGGGGAIMSESAVSITNSHFIANTTQSGGGAIMNGDQWIGTNLSVSNSIFGGDLSTDGNSAAYRGGAIYNANGTTTVINCTFKNNSTTDRGGAIYNAGNLYIKANGGNTIFSGNTDSTGSNAIFSTNDLHFNAGDSSSTGTMGTITFDDKITATGKTIYINHSTDDSALTNGSINFNNDVDVSKYNIYGGTTNFIGYVDLAKMSLLGGTVNFGKIGGTKLSFYTSTFSITAPATIGFINSGFTGNSTITLNSASGGLSTNTDTFDGTAYTKTTSPITITAGTANLIGTSFNKYQTVTAEGGVISNSGTLTITDGTFSNNHTTGDAGGAIINSGVLNIHNTSFSTNYTNSGGFYSNGGAINSSKAINIDQNSSFTGNGGGGSTLGGAIYIKNSTDLISTISNTTFSNNYASYRGGAVHNEQGTLNIADFAFNNNSSRFWGSGAICNAATINISGSSFSGNYADYDDVKGGAIENWGTASITNSSFTDNGKNADGTAKIHYGGAISNSSSLTVSNSTFTNNSAINSGGAIYNTAGVLNIQATAGGTTAFSGNTDSTGDNDVTMTGGTLNINAGTGGKISFGGQISASGVDVTINSSAVAPTLTTGNITFADTLTAKDVYVQGGTNSFATVNANSLNISNGTNSFNNVLNLNSLGISGGLSEFKNTVSSAIISISGGGSTFDSAIVTSDFDITGGTVQFKQNIDSSVLTVTGGNVTFANGTVKADSQIFLNNSNSTVNVANTTFDGSGYTKTESAVNVSSGTLDINSSSFNSYQTTTGNGGAINNNGTMVVTNTNFTNNKTAGASSTGGAIYNTGTLYIKADATQTLFSGNTDSTGSNAIAGSGQLYLNTGDSASVGTQGSITFNDVVNSTSSIHINSTSGDTTLDTGSVTFNSAINANMVDISKGTVNFNGNVTANQVDVQGGSANFNSSISSVNTNVTDGTANFNSDVASSTITQTSGVTNIKSTTSTALNIANDKLIVNGGTANVEKTTFSGNSTISLNNDSARVNIIGSTFDGTNYTGSDSALKVLDGTLFIDPTLLENYNSTSNGGVINNADNLILEDTTFTNNSTTANGGAIYNSGTASITNSTFTQNSALNGGAIYNDNGTINLKNSTFSQNSANATNGNGGAIYNKGILNIISDGQDVTFTNNLASGQLNDIYLGTNSTLNLNVKSSNQIIFNSGIDSSTINNKININKTGSLTLGDPQTDAPTSGEVVLNSAVKNSTVNLYGGTLTLNNDSYLDNDNLSTNSNGGSIYPTLNLINNSVGNINLNTLTLNSSANLKIDANLSTAIADKISATSVVDNTSGIAKLNITKINILGDSNTKNTSISVANSNVSNFIALSPTTAESVLYKYNLTYNSTSGNINFENTHQFTPSVVASPVSAIIGAYLSQLSTLSEALSRTDEFMSLPKTDRLLMRYRNQYAMSKSNNPEGVATTYMPEENEGTWFKQYTTFESVPLHNGPQVSNVGYGAILGNDTELKHFKNGADGYLTAYAGYNGSHQNYDNVGIYQNGGFLGLTGTIYKGNFFTALTASAGASNAEASTSFGSDNLTTILAGAAIKTGYNFEFKEGKYILQPNMAFSYTFADTLGYTAASGASITANTLNAFQISPGIRLIANLKNGWQPYLGVNMVWNIMDAQKLYANNIQLPQMSVSPYVEYGFGLQRKWGDRFTGYGQTMLRGGGRNGVALQFGFKWAIGKQESIHL